MKTFFLFIFTKFKEQEEVDYFCLGILGDSPLIHKVRYVMDDTTKTVIVIFESDSLKKELSEELYNIISMDDFKFYFLFEKDSLHTANLPIELKEFMFDLDVEHSTLLLSYQEENEEQKETHVLDLDDILEKIKEYGIESLTKKEKKFLDGFKN